MTDKLEQMRSGLEGKVRDTQEQMKEIKDILMATTEKNMEEGQFYFYMLATR